MVILSLSIEVVKFQSAVDAAETRVYIIAIKVSSCTTNAHVTSSVQATNNRCEILFILLAINKDIGSASKQPPKDRNFFSGENKAESDEFGAWC